MSDENTLQANDTSHAECERKMKEFEAGWKRALADYQNLKRETETAQKELAAWSVSMMVHDLLPVVDHFDQAIAHVPPETGGWLQGITHIRRELEDLLKRHAVESYGQIGEVFDPSLHEAVEHEPGQREQDQKIARVVAKGYRIQGRVLRPARVVIYQSEQDRDKQE
ncbi:nucleotide exchange factor GrpE [Candidatus Uhrbacteria bacterium]|nr:nucleotide exchange factor GrpE [Candidatus Uhrbacteria bacterium]